MIGWTMRVGAGEARDALLKQIRALCCHHLNLCASVGCGCLVEGAEQVCQEAELASDYPLHQSTGPTWSVVITSLENVVKIDVYFSGPVIGQEVRALHAAMVDQGFPVFASGHMGATNQ